MSSSRQPFRPPRPRPAARLVLFPIVPIAVAATTWPAPLPGVPLGADDATARSPELEEHIVPFVESYCLDCHGSDRPKAGVDLATSSLSLDTFWRDPRRWEKAAQVVRESAMPPRRKRQPGRDERDRFVRAVRRTIDAIPDDFFPPDPGHVVLRRLTPVEYDHTVRDLFGIDARFGAEFPSDGGGGEGFENNADTLFVPPLLLERCFASARAIVDTAPPERILLHRPGDGTAPRSAARRTLEEHLPRIFRHPVPDADVERFLAVWDHAVQRGAPYDEGVRLALVGALVSPEFLFRVERDRDASEPYRVDEHELASRLSYFLWSSMPDAALFEAAREGTLSDPATLATHVHRMLDDPRSRALAEGFAGQWLGVASLLTTVRPDPRRFEEYTEELRDSLFEEVVLFFDHLVRENRPVLEILRADYSFLDARLARHYGVADASAEDEASRDAFRKVVFQDGARGGVLGLGAVHALTSYPRRTSPVLRGKWVLEVLLGTPPPPPPPSAPGLSEDDRPRRGLTFRERLEQHRSKEPCATCHATMDPIGFGLENFDVIGRWRDEIGGETVDASGTLPTGESFQGPAELERILLERRDLVVRNLVEKMLSYALGRGLDLHDLPTIRRITRALDDGEGGMRDLILEIVRSFPFQYRKSVLTDAPQTEPPDER